MLQDAFCNIFRDLHQFKGEGHVEGWLRKVTVRSALQHLRRKNPLRFAEEYDGSSCGNEQIMPDVEMTREAILQMIQQLPDGYRTIFNMHCMEAFSYPEIAAELGIRESSVRSQYARARKLLQQMVERYLSCIL